MLADRIAVLDRHHIAQIGDPQELYRRPVNHDIAQFFGLINRFPARYAHAERLIYLSDRLFFPPPQNDMPTKHDVAVELLLRPEELELFFNRAAHECHRSDLLLLQGQVIQRKYFGHFQLLVIQIMEPDFAIKCIAHLPTHTSVQHNQRLLVGLPMNSVHLVLSDE